MLNISHQSINDKVDRSKYPSLASFVKAQRKERRRRKLLLRAVFIVLIALLFLPWTQNLRAPGYLTSLQPENRPQKVQTLIGGQIESWYVQEGMFVNKGDTLAKITEIKDQYFDPKLVERTEMQVAAKKSSLQGYREKITALDSQIIAIEQNRVLKLKQARNKLRQAHLKVAADSMDWQASLTNKTIAQAQFKRQEKLFEKGLKSRTELETRRQKLQDALAKAIAQENKFLTSKNELINARVEINSIQSQFRDKLAKARSNRFSAVSNRFTTEAEIAKLKNTLSNYAIRQGYYYIKAPQNGYVTEATQNGIGQILKEGETLLTIMPSQSDLAVAMYVHPLNIPLLNVGQEIRLQFDGWPAIIFSGWPTVSTGTFSGEIVAIDRFADAQGKYRVLIKPHPNQEPWPEELRVGGGVKTFALLNDVTLIYEIWRQINGFPPDFYTLQNEKPLSPATKKKK